MAAENNVADAAFVISKADRDEYRRIVYGCVISFWFIGLSVLFGGLFYTIGLFFHLRVLQANLFPGSWYMTWIYAKSQAARACRRRGLSEAGAHLEPIIRLASSGILLDLPPVDVRPDRRRAFRLISLGCVVCVLILVTVAKFWPSPSEPSQYTYPLVGLLLFAAAGIGIASLLGIGGRYALADERGIVDGDLFVKRARVPWSRVTGCVIERSRDVFGRPENMTLYVYGDRNAGGKAKRLQILIIPVRKTEVREQAERLAQYIHAQLTGSDSYRARVWDKLKFSDSEPGQGAHCSESV